MKLSIFNFILVQHYAVTLGMLRKAMRFTRRHVSFYNQNNAQINKDGSDGPYL